MGKERLAAFSDGVLAIIITIMVLELRVPEGAGVAALRPLLPVLLDYALSFIYIGIYWNNHHHLFSVTEKVNGGVLWANLHLLFWLSLIPFATEWAGRHPFAPVPTAVYGVPLLVAALAYGLLQRSILRVQGADSVLGAALGSDLKGKLSLALYALAIALAFVLPWLADAVYVAVALMWLVPAAALKMQSQNLPRLVPRRPSRNGKVKSRGRPPCLPFLAYLLFLIQGRPQKATKRAAGKARKV